MIRHIVLFKFKEEAEGKTRAENVAATRAMLEALPAKIDLILESHTFVGTDGINEANADLILVSDFESPEALAEYIVHPDHRAVGAFMGPLRESRMAIDLTL
ncbi:MAG: Dabb family protein [Clostridia bacterium]|nr:Dabb family protein [Clostridia bacterium]